MKSLRVWGAMVLGIAGCALTTMASWGAGQRDRVNMGFLAVILIITLWAYLAGIGKVRTTTKGLLRAVSLFKSGSISSDKTENLDFKQKYLNDRYREYKKSGSADIEEYINMADIEAYTRRGVLELVPDILTSLGILGTFVGLVLGLREFDPSGYQEMSNSMGPLIDGIKVAFLTSIYGIVAALPYSFALQSVYGDLEEAAEEFLEKFDTQVEKEPNIFENILSEQRLQNETLTALADTITEQMTSRFKDIIVPALETLKDEIERMSENQRDMLQGAAAAFASEFKKAFLSGFTEFEEGLSRANEIQNQYIKFIQISMENLKSVLSDSQSAVEAVNEKSLRNIEGVVREINQSFLNEFRTFAASLDKVNNQQNDYIKFLDTSMEKLARAYEEEQRALSYAVQELYGRQMDCQKELENAVKEIYADGQRQRLEMGEYLAAVSSMGQGLAQNEQELGETIQQIQGIVSAMAESVRSMQEESGLVKSLHETEQNAAAYRAEILQAVKDLSDEIKTGRQSADEAKPEQDGASGIEQETLQEVLQELRVLVELERNRRNRSIKNRLKFWKKGE